MCDKKDGMVRPSDDGVHIEAPPAQTPSVSHRLKVLARAELIRRRNGFCVVAYDCPSLGSREVMIANP